MVKKINGNTLSRSLLEQLKIKIKNQQKDNLQ